MILQNILRDDMAPHPERTAKRRINQWDYAYRQWPNHKSLVKSIQLQRKRETHWDDWVPLQPLTEEEG